MQEYIGWPEKYLAEEVDKSGKLKLNGAQFKNSIDYVPVDITESASYVQDIVHEMNIRNLSTSDK